MKQRIADTLIGMMMEKAYDTITVSALCAAVPVSRPAFYTYFHSKDDVLLWFIIEDFRNNLLPFLPLRITVHSSKILFGYIERNAAVYKAIYAHDQGMLLTQGFVLAFKDALRYQDKVRRADARHLGQISQDAFLAYVSHGIAAVICCWIQEDFSTPSAKIAYELAVMIEHPYTYIVDHYL